MEEKTHPTSGLADLVLRRSAIECVPLAERFVLHSPASGAILTTNHVGRAILSEPGTPEVPVDAARGILSEWQAAGLFDPQQPPYPDAVTDDGRPAPHTVRYATDWGAISVETDDPQLAEQLHEILWGAAAPDTTPAPTHLRCVGCPGGDLGVFRAGRALWGRANRDVARYLIVREAAEALCGIDRVGAVLHGAAVLGERGALLILGDSGRGKSTLAQGLIDAGCGFLADDHLPLHIDGHHLLAFATGSAVKRGARTLAEVQRLMDRIGDRNSTRDGVSYLPLAPAAAPGTPVPIAAVVFPEHADGATADLARMDAEAAFIGAISSGTRPSRHVARIAPLASLFTAVPAYTLRYGTSAQSIPACLDLLGS